MEYNIEDSKIAEQYLYMSKVKALAGPGRTAYIQTFGCQQNEADSERLAGMLREMGYALTADPEHADLILVNTCAVREHAELKAMSITGRFKHFKEQNPEMQIGMCGCMVSQEHRAEDIRNRYQFVDFVFGTAQLYRFPEILWQSLTSSHRVFCLDAENDPGNIAEGLPLQRKDKYRAWVSIMYGCNNFCTYCVVPYVRGRERSRSRGVILDEVRQVVGSGGREITLLGQNVNSYGHDLGNGYDFSDLLRDVCEVEGDFTVRFMTSHPKDASHKLFDTMAGSPKVAKALHLPLQSGSDRVLKAMNRGYTVKTYLSEIDYARSAMPEIALSTDIIAGFPGETDEEFEMTLDVLRRVRYDSVFAFVYSPRVGTKAAQMEDQVPPETRTARVVALNALQDKISLGKNQECVGKVLRVLTEGHSKTDPDKLTGRTEKGRLVHFTASDEAIGREVCVEITKAGPYDMLGEYKGIAQ